MANSDKESTMKSRSKIKSRSPEVPVVNEPGFFEGCAYQLRLRQYCLAVMPVTGTAATPDAPHTSCLDARRESDRAPLRFAHRESRRQLSWGLPSDTARVATGEIGP